MFMHMFQEAGTVLAFRMAFSKVCSVLTPFHASSLTLPSHLLPHSIPFFLFTIHTPYILCPCPCHHPWTFIGLCNTKIYLYICKRLSVRWTAVSKLSQRPGRGLASHIPGDCGAHHLVVPHVQVSIQEGFSECRRMLPDVPRWLCS